jgi:hypothetical protein
MSVSKTETLNESGLSGVHNVYLCVEDGSDEGGRGQVFFFLETGGGGYNRIIIFFVFMFL